MKRALYCALPILILTILLAETLSSTKSRNTIDLLWKARALQAVERIEEVTLNPPEPLTREMKYEMMLECAYGMILGDPNLAVKKTPLTTCYHLVFNFGDLGFLDVLYGYDDDSQELLFFAVDHLPKKHRLGIPSPTKTAGTPLQNCVTVSNVYDSNEPVLLLSLTNPFANRVVSK